MLWVRGHPTLGRHRVRTRGLLLLLQVLLVLKMLLRRHVGGGHTWLSRHTRLTLRYLSMCFFGRLNAIVSVDTVRVGGRWLRSVQASLAKESVVLQFEAFACDMCGRGTNGRRW